MAEVLKLWLTCFWFTPLLFLLSFYVKLVDFLARLCLLCMDFIIIFLGKEPANAGLWKGHESHQCLYADEKEMDGN